MSQEVRFLLMEDVGVDARLVESELDRSDIGHSLKHVSSPDAFLRELQDFKPDVVLCDYLLPRCDGLSTLTLVRQRFPDLPFIFVSGVMEEELVSEGFKRGATDYVSKKKLARIVPAVKRALRERDTRRRLQQLEKTAAMGQLMAGFAHEIKSPIGFIDSNIQTLSQYVDSFVTLLQLSGDLRTAVANADLDRARALDQESKQFEQEINLDFVLSDVRSLLEESKSGLKRIKDIALDLRTFIREREEVMETFLIEDLLDSVIGIVWNEIKYKAELKKNYGGVPPIHANRQNLGRVFINLFVNATQSIERDGIITVDTYEKDGFVCVGIGDNGERGEEKKLPFPFDPHLSHQPPEEGEETGFRVIHDIVKNHGGDIEMESKAGAGTLITVKIPSGD